MTTQKMLVRGGEGQKVTVLFVGGRGGGGGGGLQGVAVGVSSFSLVSSVLIIYIIIKWHLTAAIWRTGLKTVRGASIAAVPTPLAYF